MTDFRALASADELTTLIARSSVEPIVIFKHSDSCGSSWMARADLVSGDLPMPVHEIVVQRSRDLAHDVAARLRVRHESPQALVVAGGAAVWHSSHAGVTAERVRQAWTAAADALTPAPAR
ncbi:MAG: bacillithiol system redox-active protein YtxJ [Vicinamibacterales bacterium]